MIRYAYVSMLLGSMLALAGTSRPALAQPAVAPASAVRVIEIIDPGTGERVREVAADLTKPEIARIQRGLASAGFPGRATGILTADTRHVLGRFQDARGLYHCECVSYETLIALTIRPLVVASIVASIPSGYGYGYGYGSDVVWIASQRSHGFGHGSGVVVGHGPSVFVGHAPAIGAGQLRRPPARSPRPPVHDPRPSRPRPRSGISGSGAEIRALTPARPQPRAPFPGSANVP